MKQEVNQLLSQLISPLSMGQGVEAECFHHATEVPWERNSRTALEK